MWVWMFVCNLTFEMKKIIAKHLFCWHCIHLKLRGISRHVKTRFSYEIFELYCLAFSCWSCLILWLEHVGGHSKHAVCCKLSPGQTLGTTTLEARNDSGRWKYILPHFNTKLHLHEYTPDMRLLQRPISQLKSSVHPFSSTYPFRFAGMRELSHPAEILNEQLHNNIANSAKLRWYCCAYLCCQLRICRPYVGR